MAHFFVTRSVFPVTLKHVLHHFGKLQVQICMSLWCSFLGGAHCELVIYVCGL